MTPQNVEIVQRAFDALAGGGVEAMLPFVHERFEMVTPPELAAEPDTYSGHDGVRRWFDTFYEAMDEVRIEPQEIEPLGDQVALAFRMVARGRSTGLEVVQSAAALCTVADELISGLEFFATWQEALEAAEHHADDRN